MSCLPEYRYSIYLDGELEGDSQRAVEAHLVGCARCRELVVALQEEALLISDVLHDRRPAEVPLLTPRARAKGLALGLTPALVAVALVVTVGGWLLERELPSGISWLSPLKLIGAYEMVFDMVFLLRYRAPELFDLAVAVGVMGSIAAVSTFLVGAAARRLGGGLAPALMLFGVAGGLAVGTPASALQLFDDEEAVLVSAGETIEETLVASGESVTIEGTLAGDLIALAERVVIRGRVVGNVYVAAREVEIGGEIEGSVHAVGERVFVEGRVAGNFYGAAETLTVRDVGSIGRDALLFGEAVRMNGQVGRDVFTASDSLELRGTVGRNVASHGASLRVHDGVQVGGDLTAQLPDGHEPEISSGARIAGETVTGVLEHPMPHHGSRWMDASFYMRAFVFLASAFLVGMALHTLFPGLFEAELETSNEFFRAMGFGFVALITTPIFLVLCLVTVVGIPIGIIGFFVYLTTLFVSVIVVASLVGVALMGSDPDTPYGFGASLLVGLLLVTVAVNLPIVGVLLRVLVLLTGLGLLLTSGYEAWKRGEPIYDPIE